MNRILFGLLVVYSNFCFGGSITFMHYSITDTLVSVNKKFNSAEQLDSVIKEFDGNYHDVVLDYKELTVLPESFFKLKKMVNVTIYCDSIALDNRFGKLKNLKDIEVVCSKLSSISSELSLSSILERIDISAKSSYKSIIIDIEKLILTCNSEYFLIGVHDMVWEMEVINNVKVTRRSFPCKDIILK